jgi:RND family efflux transporter MFP subunit
MSRNWQRTLLIGVILGFALLVQSQLARMKPPLEKQETEKVDMLVDVLELEILDERFAIHSQGTVKPVTETILSAEVSGSIVSISPKFVAGGLFAAGEELLRIDATRYEVAVDQAEALLKQRQIEYDGASKLRSQGYRAEAEYASAGAALATAKAALVTARRDLEKTRIRLPYAGMVRAKEADLGQFVNPGSRLGVVFATDFAEVRLPLTDRDLAFVDLPLVSNAVNTEGPRVVLEATQRGQQSRWDAQVVRTEGVVDEKTRVTYVVARISDPYQLNSSAGVQPLPMGSFVSARIDGRQIANVVRVPRSALRGGNQLLLVDKDLQLRIRTVDVLRADGEYAWLQGTGLAGERISLTPIESPVNGMRVRVGPVADALARSED